MSSPRLTVEQLAWSPPEWSLNGFPLETPGQETVHLENVVSTLLALADSVTEADSTALGPAMHVGHILTTRQGSDGQWPETLNCRTGFEVGEGRTLAPLKLFQRLTLLLETTEFDHVFARMQAGKSE